MTPPGFVTKLLPKTLVFVSPPLYNTYMTSKTEQMLDTVLNFVPTMTVREFVEFVEAVEDIYDPRPDLFTHEGRVAYARTVPQVMEPLRSDKWVVALKELRTAIQNEVGPRPHDYYENWPAGLKACKEAIDDLRSPI